MLPAEERNIASALGTAFHSIMQQVDLKHEPTLDALVARAADAQHVGQHASTLLEWVKQTLASPLAERVRKARRVWRELPFCVASHGVITEGYLDLLFEEQAGLVLVDYKTDQVELGGIEAAVEAHRAQLEAYRQAVSQLTGQAPRETWLYLVRLGLARHIM